MAGIPPDGEQAMSPDLAAIWSMSDATGIFQHSIGPVPDRRHGYCTDDNARALMLMNMAKGVTAGERMRWSSVYGGFLFHAWNPDEGRFRNFMGFDRQWREIAGSQDSNGRALWALGHTVEQSPIEDMRLWAGRLLGKVLARLTLLDAPRAVAFAALAGCALGRAGQWNARAQAHVVTACERLCHMAAAHRRPGWIWFEPRLTYDNPRLCQALIEGGAGMERQEWIDTGLETLQWIMDCQTSAKGFFSPVGSEGFALTGQWETFDQQPLEAQAAIEACRAAWIATGDEDWIERARCAYQWYFGVNERGVAIADLASGRCFDGLTRDGLNENSGAESILAFHLSHYAFAAMDCEKRPPVKTGTDTGRPIG